MNLSRKLKINWWLWMALSIPPIIYSWVRVRDIKGMMISDWELLGICFDRAGHKVDAETWNFFSEKIVWSAMPCLVLGWIAQYFIVMVWQMLRRRNKTSEPTTQA